MPIYPQRSGEIDVTDRNVDDLARLLNDVERQVGINTSAISGILSSGGYAQLVIVAKSGGDFSSIQSAINWIPDNTVSKRYLVLVLPGTYEEQVTMKEWVDIAGFDRRVCAISFGGNNNGTVIAAERTQLFNIRIISENAGNWAVVSNDKSHVHLKGCDILTHDDANAGSGFKCTGSSWVSAHVEDCRFILSGTASVAIWFEGDPAAPQDVGINIRNCQFNTNDATTGGCIYVKDLYGLTVRNCHIVTSATAYGIKMEDSGVGTTQLECFWCHLFNGTDTLEIGANCTLRISACTLDGSIDRTGTLQGYFWNVSGAMVLEGDGCTTHFRGAAGGSGEGILYLDSGGNMRYGIFFEATNKVVIANRAANGTVHLRANSGVAGPGGEVEVGTILDTAMGVFQQSPRQMLHVGGQTVGKEGVIRVEGDQANLKDATLQLYRRDTHIGYALLLDGAGGTGEMLINYDNAENTKQFSFYGFDPVLQIIKAYVNWVMLAEYISFTKTNGGGGEGLRYKDSGGTYRNFLTIENPNIVTLYNWAANGTVEVHANTSTAGVGGDVHVATFEDDKYETKQGIVRKTTRVTSTPYAVLATDEIIMVDTDAASRTVNLPAGVDGTHYRISNTGASGNPVTLNPNGAELLLGSNSAQTIYDGETLDIYYETTEGWW